MLWCALAETAGMSMEEIEKLVVSASCLLIKERITREDMYQLILITSPGLHQGSRKNRLMMTLLPGLQPGQNVPGPHNEHNLPRAGWSGSSLQNGRSSGPVPWKLHWQPSAHTCPIKPPSSPGAPRPLKLAPTLPALGPL